MEVLSAQNLYNENIDEIKIIGMGSHKYGINNYDALVSIGDLEFILYRDLDFKNIKIVQLLNTNILNINIEVIDRYDLIK